MAKEKAKTKKEEFTDVEGDFLLDILDENEVYVIKLFNNKKRPEDKQMKVHIKPLSGKDLSIIASQIRNDIKEFQKENPDDNREFVELYNMFSERWEFAHRILKLENFRFKVGDEVKELTDPLDLFDYPNSKFALITNELRQKFLEIDLLNSKNL